MGGGELSVVELIRGAKQRGYRPHVVVPAPGEFADKMKEIGVDTTVVKYFYWGRPYLPKENLANMQAIQKLTGLIKTLKIDCVVTNTLMIPWGALAASATDTPHIWVTREKLNNHRAHLFENYDFVSTYSNIVFANSRDNAEYLQFEIGMKNVKQFYSFVDPKQLSLDASIKTPRIINLAANIRPSKDQMEIAKALVELNKRKKLSLQTVFVGGFSEDDEYFKKVKAVIDNNNLGDKVSFVGFHAEPFKLMGANDIFVRSSKYESLGRTITEAMKLGLICVAADIDSSKEAFNLGGGVLYKSGDPEDLADALQKIINDPAKYLELAQKAEERALKNLSEQACHDPFFAELDGVVTQHNPRSEFRHLTTQFDGLVEAIKNLENLKDHYQNLAEKRKQTLDKIVNSKSWKTATHLQNISKIASKPAKFVKRNRKT